MKKNLSIILSFALLVSCSSDIDEANKLCEFRGQVSITAKPFEFENTTRTSLTNTGSKIEFGWEDGESIGIFPVAPTTNVQAKQVLKASQNNSTATFDGAGWALKRGNTYVAFSPFNDNACVNVPYTAVPIDMTGQVQVGNNNLDHIGSKYDYMYASASIPSEGGVVFDFSHACAIVMLELTMPTTGTWTNVTLKSTKGDDVFISNATMDVSSGDISSTENTDCVSLGLKSINTSTNNVITVFLAVLPTTTGELEVIVSKSDGTAFKAPLDSKTLAAGKAYKWNAVVNMYAAPGIAKAIDLGLPSGNKWANMNVGSISPENNGTYFAWGETTGYQYASDGSIIPAIMKGTTSKYYVNGKTKTNYNSWTYYKWCDGTQYKITKYPSGYLNEQDDAAHANWGGNWYMPSERDFNELINYCYWSYTGNYCQTKAKGYIVYKAQDESDGGKCDDIFCNYRYSIANTHIFLPTSFNSNLGAYWTNVANWGQTAPRAVRYLFIQYSYSEPIKIEKTDYRYLGKMVRPIWVEKE